MKSIFFFIIFVSICFEVAAQEKIEVISHKQEKKINQNHTSVFKVGYGIGNIWKTFLKNGINAPGYKVTSTGPYTLMYEYGLLKKISVGVAVSYSKLKGIYSYNGFEFNDQLTIFTALARANYHFGKFEKFDPYIGGGLGYVNSKYSNNLNTSSSNVPGLFDYSAQLGANYFLSKHFGFYGEVGYVAGSFVQLGFAGKF